MRGPLSSTSPAKINLTLRVSGVRPDGFHEIESLVALVGLCDMVRVRATDDGRLTIACDDLAVPTDATNLVWKAAEALRGAAGPPNPAAGGLGASVEIQKRIPLGGGLGGGSSNAATVLRLLNQLWELGLGDERLAEIGAGVGSDVPLFLNGPLSVIRGRGERVERLTLRLKACAVLVLPRLHCASGAVYQAWDRLPPPPERPPIDVILRQASSVDALMPLLFNDLEPAAFEVCPSLSDLAGRIRREFPGPLCMTGSGAGLFRLADDAATARSFAEAVAARFGVRVEVTPLLI